MTFDDPVKCADCGIWWRGMEHRCHLSASITVPSTGSWPPAWWKQQQETTTTAVNMVAYGFNVTPIRREDPPDDAVGALVPA